MPLAGYKPETRTIELAGGNSFDVKGLSLTEIEVLIREHFNDLDALMSLFDGADKLTPDQWQKLIVALLSNAPGFVANVIALAAGEGTADDAARLPGPVQIKAMHDIAELTFSEVGGIKKSVEMIAALLKKSGTTNKLTKAVTKTRTNR